VVDEDEAMSIDTGVVTGRVGSKRDKDNHMVVDSAADEKQASSTDMVEVRSPLS